jgi:hypothetical protein
VTRQLSALARRATRITIAGALTLTILAMAPASARVGSLRTGIQLREGAGDTAQPDARSLAAQWSLRWPGYAEGAVAAGVRRFRPWSRLAVDSAGSGGVVPPFPVAGGLGACLIGAALATIALRRTSVRPCDGDEDVARRHRGKRAHDAEARDRAPKRGSLRLAASDGLTLRRWRRDGATGPLSGHRAAAHTFDSQGARS